MTTTPTKPARLATALAAAALALSGCSIGSAVSLPATSASPAPAAPAGGVDAAAALAQLDTIAVKGRAPKTGYTRELFGSAWKDVDRDGCDTRNDILRRDLTDIKVKPGTRDCVVLSGHLADPYTGEGINFARGGASEVDIDHLVPLSESWQKGAQSWDQDKRERFANDPANLAASSAAANRSKGDSDLATWLPPNRGQWCKYVAGIVNVKAAYGLWMTQAEHDKARQILNDCRR